MSIIMAARFSSEGGDSVAMNVPADVPFANIVHAIPVPTHGLAIVMGMKFIAQKEAAA